jgi:hypothetical protein
MAMPEDSSREPSNDQNLREISVFEPPSYNISHGPDKALQWDPPADSDELAIALSYHFPVEKTLKRKMQAAMEIFLREAGPNRLNCVKRVRDLNPNNPGVKRPTSEAIPGLLSFDSKTLEDVKIKRKRRAYEKVERDRVRSNRGNACEVHRRQKLKVCIQHPIAKEFLTANILKCDPTKCKRNAQFQQSNSLQVDPALKNPVLLSSRPHLAEQSNLARRDISLYQQDMIETSSSPRQMPNEAVLTRRSSNTSYSTPSNEPDLTDSNSRLAPHEMAGTSPAEPESQFMGFETDFTAFDDSFSFSLDPPFFLSHTSDNDTRYSWKPDEFLLSILRDSMYV